MLLECFLILCLQVEVEGAEEVEVRLVVEVVAAEEEAEVSYMVFKKKVPEKLSRNFTIIPLIIYNECACTCSWNISK